MIALNIAWTHLTSRKRQTAVSLVGVVLGVAFFLAVSALMRGSEKDFITRLIDNSPHITVSDEFRTARLQPARLRWPDDLVEIAGLRPNNETRGIRGWRYRLGQIESLPGLKAAPVLVGSAVLLFAGQEQGISLSGIVPARMRGVSSIEEKLVEGSLDDLEANPGGIIIGAGLAEKFSLRRGSTVNLVAGGGSNRSLTVVAIFRTGNAGYDESQTYVLLKRAQLLLGRPDRVNRFIIKLADASQALLVASRIEAMGTYKAVSWAEASEDILNVLFVRNVIMYSVVSAILLVASFGIYNTLSTIVMEKTRDIAILKSVGFQARDIRHIFVLEGLIVGTLGSVLGLAVGAGLMQLMASVQIRPPGGTAMVNLPVWWGGEQFLIAAGFALLSCLLAAWLPARKAGRLHPVDILRGAT
ncbi:ABC transporter permease [Chitinimonas prasina]|uniref:ABC transporter permease n=1 Tax=Chitinimonas prasina TaxID=1434937 RepID=A0ABQ5YDM8_9NEIS|nr:ABC transporter permease [Chitinimonas prasina]GLR13070.1 ABC transporter permease [Chitinimonas prasina]